MKVKLTTLAENTAGKGRLLAEFGLSILVETPGQRVLFDTGMSFTVVHNARALGVELRNVDTIVLSHGHLDHTGGLKNVLQDMARSSGRTIEIIAHPDIWAPRYARQRGERPHYAGIPYLREELESIGARFRLERGPTTIGHCLMTTGEVPRLTSFERLDEAVLVREGEDWRQDHLLDDQSLIVRTDKGLVVVLGCAHSGVINTLRHARRITGEERIRAVIGGTHLGFASEQQLDQTVLALREFGIERLGVSHCTGLAAAARLSQEFKDSFFFNTTGTTVEFD